MRKTIAIFILGFLSFTIAAFGQKTISITGKLNNPVADNIIAVNATSTKLVPENKQDKIPLDKDGNFKVSIPVTERYNWIILVHNNKRLDFYAEAGSELQLNANGNDFDTTARFSGKGSGLPQYFADATKSRGGIMIYYRKLQELSLREPSTFKAGIDSVKMQEQAIYDIAVTKKSDIPKDFNKFWTAFLTYSTYDAMLNYPMLHQQIMRQSGEIKDIPKPLFEVPQKTPVAFDDKKLDVPFYQTYAQSYYVMQLNAAGYTNMIGLDAAGQPENRTKALQQTDSVLKLIYKNMPTKTAEFAAGRLIANESKTWTMEELENRIATFKKQYPKSERIPELESIIKELKKFSPGEPALNFSFKTIEGQEMKLSDLKGKVVYLDFWASWCGPCKGEMPYAKVVKEHFKERNDVVFLYVSIDDKEEAWKKGIESLSITGMHTRTPGWAGEIAKQYEIQSIPAYFLIDKKGNFVIKKTPRPSQSEEVIKLIEGLL